MTSKFNRAFYLAFLVLSSALYNSLSAQTGSLSPYSRYGIGDISKEGFTSQAGMGGLGAALSSPNSINIINPASYTADSMIVFEFGAFGEMRKLERNSGSTNQNSASFSYFSLAFPVVRNKASVAFGLIPYSSVGYEIQVDETDVPDIGTIRYLYEGAGGFNKFFIGTGVKLGSHLSLGINASYLFGTINQIKSIEFPDGVNFFNTRYVDAITAKGFYFNYGILYEGTVFSNLRLTAGITGTYSGKVNAVNNQYYFNYVISPLSGGELLKDSVQNEQQARGKIALPDNIRGGIMIGRPGKWQAGVDVAYNNWANYESFGSNDSLKNSYTIHIGGERTGEKVIYRLGAYYGSTFLNLRNTQLDEYGITFGLGLNKLFPKRPPSGINIAIEAGRRGTTKNNLIREQYLKLHLGFSLTDIWFIKPKYD